MGAAGLQLHPACRVRQEGFGLLFYDSRGPRLLFAETGNLLPSDYYDHIRQSDELPDGLTAGERQVLNKFVNQLVEKGFLREQ